MEYLSVQTSWSQSLSLLSFLVPFLVIFFLLFVLFYSVILVFVLFNSILILVYCYALKACF